MTPGGKFVVPRVMLHSELWENKPSWWFKVWFYILANANFKDHSEKLRRGDLLTSYETIYLGCNFKKSEVSKPKSIENVISYLKSTKLITTRKTTWGFIISVCNYDQLQSFEAFPNDTENDTPNDGGTIQERYDKETNVTNETTYNYLPKSKTGKEQTLGENPNLGTDTQPSGNTQSYKEKAVGVTTELGSASQLKQKPPRIILHNNLDRVKRTFEKEYGTLSPEKLDEDYISLNTTSCVKGIQYYFWKYKSFLGKEHPLLKLTQLDNCFHNFNWMVWKLEGLNLPPSKIDEIFVKAIDRWFGTTTPSANNLNLNHFAGTTRNRPAYSEILERSIEEVLYELGILSDAPKDTPKVGHYEDVI